MKKSPLLAVLLSAFVWPGAGQIYNQEYKRGAVLIGLTLLLCLSFVIGAEREIKARLAADEAVITDMAKTQAAIQDLLKKNSTYVSTFNFLMFAAWFYSALDAYWTAKKTQEPPEEKLPDEDSE